MDNRYPNCSSFIARFNLENKCGVTCCVPKHNISTKMTKLKALSTTGDIRAAISYEYRPGVANLALSMTVMTLSP